MTSLRRIHNEVQYIQRDKEENKSMFTLSMIDENMFHWKAILYGPKDSLYEGYEFDISIKLPENYPMSPPNVKFISPIKHLNINDSGDICVDILKNKWTSSQNMTSVLMSIILLLTEPNISDPFNNSLSELYRENKDRYYEEIKECNKRCRKIKK